MELEMRYLFRSFWRLVYGNPEYLRYSGSWDSRIVDGEPEPARFWHLRHWFGAFLQELYLYRLDPYREDY